MSYLLDTNVLSELARPRPDERVTSWLSGHAAVDISVVTVEELFFGLAARPNARVERIIEMFLDAFCRIQPVTSAIARHAGILRGQLSKRGRVRTQADMLIAATVSAHGLTLATRNVRDFDGCGIAVENPFR